MAAPLPQPPYGPSPATIHPQAFTFDPLSSSRHPHSSPITLDPSPFPYQVPLLRLLDPEIAIARLSLQ
eukprot:3673858-Rhodomonas_salina.2